MYRCGIPREDGTVRISVLCSGCASRALKILIDRGRPFFRKEICGDLECEVCNPAQHSRRAINER